MLLNRAAGKALGDETGSESKERVHFKQTLSSLQISSGQALATGLPQDLSVSETCNRKTFMHCE